MEEERRGKRGLTRREILIGGGVLGAAALGITSAGSPFSGGAQSVSFWHLFGGGDGERLTGILADIDSEHADSDVRELILPWGNPYYTKLALAAVGGSPPDVAVVHATRLPSFAPAGLLEELTPEMLARHGLKADDFLEEPWKSGQSGGKQYAIPLDTHPFVLYYNTELCEKAGLLEGGKLPALDGADGLLDACQEIKKATGKTGLVYETRGVTPWRVFLTLYNQLGGPKILDDGGTRITWTTPPRSSRSSGWRSRRSAGSPRPTSTTRARWRSSATGPPRKRMREKANAAMLVVIYAVLVMLALIWIVPILWAIATVVTSAGSLFTIPVGLATVQTSYGALYAQQMAIAILGALPLLIAFMLFQRQIVQGIANTGLKG